MSSEIRYLRTNRFDVKNGNVVQERAEGDANHVGRRNAVLDGQRPLVEDHQRARRHDKQDGNQLEMSFSLTTQVPHLNNVRIRSSIPGRMNA